MPTSIEREEYCLKDLRRQEKAADNTFISISNSASEKPVVGNKCYLQTKDSIHPFTEYLSNVINQCVVRHHVAHTKCLSEMKLLKAI